jgi:septal ring factor EnvC (AmiA/AmiB activator)
MSTNERTFIRTIVKWSRSAAILATIIVLLVVGVFVQKVNADAIKKQESYQVQLVESQTKTSKIESNLTEVKTQKEQLATEVQTKDARIQQLEQENASLK